MSRQKPKTRAVGRSIRSSGAKRGTRVRRRTGHSRADLQATLKQRERELTEALERQAAIAEVLQVIGSSPGDLTPVFDTMLAKAVRICDARFGLMFLREGDAFRAVALHGASPAFAEERRRNPVIRPSPVSTLGRALASKRPVQTPDVLKIPNYFDTPPGFSPPKLTKPAGART